jgi:hypothetical protein
MSQMQACCATFYGVTQGVKTTIMIRNGLKMSVELATHSQNKQLTVFVRTTTLIWSAEVTWSSRKVMNSSLTENL